MEMGSPVIDATSALIALLRAVGIASLLAVLLGLCLIANEMLTRRARPMDKRSRDQGPRHHYAEKTRTTSVFDY